MDSLLQTWLDLVKDGFGRDHVLTSNLRRLVHPKICHDCISRYFSDSYVFWIKFAIEGWSSSSKERTVTGNSQPRIEPWDLSVQPGVSTTWARNFSPILAMQGWIQDLVRR